MRSWLFPVRISTNRLVAATRHRGLVALLACLATAPAWAATPPPPRPDYNLYEFTPFYGYVFGGEFEDPNDESDRDVAEDNNFGLIVNIAADSWRHYEFLLASESTTVEGEIPIDMDIQYLQIGGPVQYQDAVHVIPYS